MLGITAGESYLLSFAESRDDQTPFMCAEDVGPRPGAHPVFGKAVVSVQTSHLLLTAKFLDQEIVISAKHPNRILGPRKLKIISRSKQWRPCLPTDTVPLIPQIILPPSTPRMVGTCSPPRASVEPAAVRAYIYILAVTFVQNIRRV